MAIDIEEYSKQNRRPPRSDAYKIRVDRQTFIVEKAIIAGEEILALVEKSLSEWSLNMKIHGGRRIKVDARTIDLCEGRIERFETVRRQAQQG